MAGARHRPLFVSREGDIAFLSARRTPARGRGRQGGTMHFVDKGLISITSLVLTLSLTSTAFAATITGSVTGPDGKPFMGAFVVAQNTQTKMTVSVLSNAQGSYRIGNLPDATYTVSISTMG